MKPITKIGIVGAGYAGAILIASVALAIRMAANRGPNAQASGGMYAFGDAVLFVGVFGVTSLVPTSAALIFLRPYRQFWAVLSAVAVCVAGTGLTAVVLFTIGRRVAPPSPLATLAGLSALRIIVAPLFALTFLVCAVITPNRGPRLAFLAAVLFDAAVSACAALFWFVHVFLHEP